MNTTIMTDLITSTFAQLCCFCFPCSREKRDANEEESDAEALEKARQWREKMANAENGGRPPDYQAPTEMTQRGVQGPSEGHVREPSSGGTMGDGGHMQTRPGQ